MVGLIIIDGTDLTDRLLDGGTSASGQITDIFGTLAQTKTYRFRDYDGYLNPFEPEGFFNLRNYRGLEITESDSLGVVTFRGTIDKVQMTDSLKCIVTASEPLTIFLDWPVEATDQNTYSGFQVAGAVAQGVSVLTVDGGSNIIPDGTVCWFGDSKVPSYLATSTDDTGGATTEITLDRPLETPIDDNQTITFAVPQTTTGPQALKDALETANPDILLDGTFDILAASDTANGYQIIVNVMEQDDIDLRSYIQQIASMTQTYIFQKNDGYYTCRRGLQWDGENITDEVSGDELCAPVEPEFDDSELIIGYSLIFKRSTNEAARLDADVDPALVRKHRGIKYWKPVPTASTYKGLKYLYASKESAAYFGNLRLAYYSEPQVIVSCTGKRAYNQDPNRALDIYIGKQVSLTLRSFVDEPAIVVAFQYDEASLSYKNITFKLNKTVSGQASPEMIIAIGTEAGGSLLTEAGGLLLIEG